MYHEIEMYEKGHTARKLAEKIQEKKGKRPLTIKRKFEAVLILLFIGITLPLSTVQSIQVNKSIKDGTWGRVDQFTQDICQGIIRGDKEVQTKLNGTNATVDLTDSYKAEFIGKCQGVSLQPETVVDNSGDNKKLEVTIQVAPVLAKEPEKVPFKVGASDKQNEMVAYAWEKYHDKMFIYLIEAESGYVNKRSQRKGSNGHYDYGYMQINDGYHRAIVGADEFKINDDSVEQGKYQIDIGYKLYKGGTKFYGLDKLKYNKEFYSAVDKNFIWK